MDHTEAIEDEHFEDYTTASDWEFFIVNVERILNEWQGRPIEQENINKKWAILDEKISFSDFTFKFSYYKKLVEPVDSIMSVSTMSTSVSNPASSSNNNFDSYPAYLQSTLSKDYEVFPPKFEPHKVAGYFGITEFAILSSAHTEPLQNESKLKALLSSACIALNNTNSSFPIFIQFHHWNQQYYCGIAESCGMRTHFQMTHLKKVPNQHRYLSGLLSIFKSKLKPTLSVPVGITAHFFYKMLSWHPKYTFDSFPPEILDEIQNKVVPTNDDGATTTNVKSWNEFHAFTTFLPFGSLDDPFQELEFVAGWPYLTEDVVVDSPSYSDLEPLSAPECHFGLRPHVQGEFRLYDSTHGIWELHGESRTIEDVLGKKLENSGDLQYISALDRLALANSPLPVPLNRVISNVNRAQKQLLFSPAQYTDLPPLSSDQLAILLEFLFPDSSNSPNFPFPSVFDCQPEFKKEHIAAQLEGLVGIKSAPMGSLVWRLAVILSYINAYIGYSSAVAHLWAEVVLELRYRYENSILIPGLETGSPNSGTCLLNQKLQMLNCCIEKKIQREKKEQEKPSTSEIESPVEESEDEDDEFFDCDENMSSNVTENLPKMNKPVGRLRKCGRLRLLKTGEPMYIPVTQDPAPLTEDVVEEQAKILVEFGNDAEGSEQRAKMMSASLLSDMESFKAANPGCVIEDFVRWYSPRDFIETSDLDSFGNPVGTLSVRMMMPGNLWMDVWSQSQSVPARRQRRLFDDTREAEKVLRWMSSRSLRDISQLIFPCLIHAVTLKILEEADNLSIDYKIPTALSQQVTQLTRSITPSTSSNSSSNNGNNMDINDTNANNYCSYVMSMIGKCEKEITQVRSFQQKFPFIDLDEIIKSKASCLDDLDKASEAEFIPTYIKVAGGAKSKLGEVIKEIFHMEQARNQTTEPEKEFKFGEPVRRVFVLRYSPIKRTASDSQYNQEETLPQRMSCLIKNDEFQLAGTFTSKTEL